jgi:TRAP-type mannitol/chloroaromatic compound transport system permease large subunit
MELIAQNMAPIMFASLILFLILGYPVAFALAANGLLFFVVGVELAPLSGGSINLSWPLLTAMPDRLWGVMSNETLLAIPFFTFMGIVLERSGMAEDLLDTIGQLFGPIRGGLAYAVIFVGALLAATTGVVAASGHRDGPDLAADHAALRLRPPPGQRASSRRRARWRRSFRRRSSSSSWPTSSAARSATCTGAL